MIPLSDGLRARHFPFVNWTIIIANFAVFIFWELPHMNAVVIRWSFYACTVNDSCHMRESWGLTWLTSMFMHGGWDHILGNMIFLVVFGKNVEDAYGHFRYLVFYLVGGFVAGMTQTAVTLWFGSVKAAHVPTLGASGAIAAVLGAYIVLYPESRILTLAGIFLVHIRAYWFLGIWFLFQLIDANAGMTSASANGGGVAFFAHIGGFLFGVLVTAALLQAGRLDRQEYEYTYSHWRPVWG